MAQVVQLTPTSGTPATVGVSVAHLINYTPAGTGSFVIVFAGGSNVSYTVTEDPAAITAAANA